MRTLAYSVVATLLLACSASESRTTPAGPDATAPVSVADPAMPPAPPQETPLPSDAGADGAPADDDLLGTIAGFCGALKAMLGAPSPGFVTNDLTFAPTETYAKTSLSPDGQRLFDTANAGGSSTESEVMSFEVLRHCEGAALLKTETEIHYAPPDPAGPNSITDILLDFAGTKIGVSVTRAYKPKSIPLTDADVKALLEKKLAGINRSSERVLPDDRWTKQILHVFAATDAAADATRHVWDTLDPALRASTIVVLTHTHGGGFIYCDPDPPLGSECP